jgi:predicted CopG family antitoxin
MLRVEDGAYERLQQHRLPGESDDDLVRRLIRARRPAN